MEDGATEDTKSTKEESITEKVRWQLMRRSGIAVCLILEFLKWKPEHIYQVGIGVHHKEIEVMRVAWPDAYFFGFEPHPEIYESVKDDYPGVLENYAITDREGRQTLYYRPRHKDGASLINSLEDQSEVSVKTTTLDNTFSCPAVPSLLWLDCEGSELKALQGAKEFLPGIDAINIEVAANPLSDEWPDSVKLHDYLEDRGFYLQHIHTQRASLGQYDAVYVRREMFDPKYCCSVHEIKRHRRDE